MRAAARTARVQEGFLCKTDKGTYVRLLHPPAEGRVVENERGMDVGDRVKVKLIDVNQERGFIDFAGTE